MHPKLLPLQVIMLPVQRGPLRLPSVHAPCSMHLCKSPLFSFSPYPHSPLLGGTLCYVVKWGSLGTLTEHGLQPHKAAHKVVEVHGQVGLRVAGDNEFMQLLVKLEA